MGCRYVLRGEDIWALVDTSTNTVTTSIPSAGTNGIIVDSTGTTVYATMSAVVDGGGTCADKDCWKRLGPVSTPKGFKYVNKDTNAEGAFVTLVKEGVGTAKVLWKGKGLNLPLPAPVAIDKFFNQTSDVTVRLLRSDGAECWEAVFTANKKNKGDLFRAVTP